MEDNTEADYTHAKRVKDFDISNLREYHDLYVQSNSLVRDLRYSRYSRICN